jgi:transposase-like protein
MKRKRHSTDEIIRKLREAEGMETSGTSVAEVCQKLEVSAATLARWRKPFRGMEDDQIKQLKAVVSVKLRTLLKSISSGRTHAVVGRSRRPERSAGRRRSLTTASRLRRRYRLFGH